MDLKNLTKEQLIKYIELKIIAHEEKRIEMRRGIDYYNYKHAIDEKKRAVIGKSGELKTIRGLPNTIIKDNQYARALDQKRNYLFAEKPNIDSKNTNAMKFLNEFIDKRFMRTMNYLAIDSYNCGIAWLFMYTDGEEIKYKRLSPLDVIPIWKNDNNESLEAVILQVTKNKFEGNEIKKELYYYFYTEETVKIYKYDNGHLEYKKEEAYLEKDGLVYSYKKIPFVYFRQPYEQPLLNRVMCLQDALNLLLSNYADNMFENPMNSILILKNYDGENLEDFRENLAEYKAIKVRTADGSQGGVDTLEVEVNSENYKVIIELIKKAIAHNARSLYLDNEKTSNAPNTLNIKAMYADLELDANALELEFSASFDYMFDFIGTVKNIDFSDVDITFKRKMMINDESVVEMIRNSIGIVSNETLRASHPLVTDAREEEKRIKKEREEALKYYDDYAGLGGEVHGELLGQENRKS
ncbi:SPP1 family phage portal protein [Peptoniphilus olsenii]|uniref:SPP1 family phage portal protein n=1 Tax=Peptoniphilus olsenii TaxID=411570 RepID=A0ABV2J760_9FIRM